MKVIDLEAHFYTEEYLKYLYSPEGQEIAAKNYYRPTNALATGCPLNRGTAQRTP